MNNMQNPNVSRIKLLCNTSFTQKDVLVLLSFLSDCSPMNPDNWNIIIKNLPPNHHIFTYNIATSKNILGGMITIIIEQKLSHGGAKVAHIEDLVVSPEYLNLGIASELLLFAYNFAKNNGCYKIILNCDENLKLFYEQNNFITSGLLMKITL